MIWLNVITGGRFTEYPPGSDTKVARKGYTRLVGGWPTWRTSFYIKREELCAPIWMKTADRRP